MNKVKKWLIGAAAAAALVAGGIIASKANYKESHKEKIITGRPIAEKRISWKNPQEQINIAFRIANPSNIREIIYDPDFTETDKYLRFKMNNDFPEKEIIKAIQSARKASPGHNMGVPGIFKYMGDGEKRPVFARRELSCSPNIITLEDIASAIDHEDAHTEEERYGLDFYDTRKKGEETGKLVNTEKMRINMVCAIGEIGAFAYQLDKIQKGSRKPSKQLKEHVENWFIYLKTVVETEKAQYTLRPPEQEFYEAKRRRYPEIFKKF